MIYTFCARYLRQYKRRFSSNARDLKRPRTTSNRSRLFSRSLRYLSKRGHISMHVPIMVIAWSSRLGTRGSSILPSAIARFRSASRALTNYLDVSCSMSKYNSASVPPDRISPVLPVSQALCHRALLPLAHCLPYHWQSVCRTEHRRHLSH